MKIAPMKLIQTQALKKTRKTSSKKRQPLAPQVKEPYSFKP